MNVLGISCWYHDAAAALVVDGEIVAAAQEERFSRRKHDAGFPENAVRYCLAEGGVGTVDAVAFYDKPLLKFHRILESYLAVAPKGLSSFVQAVPLWLREKLWIPPRIEEALDDCGVVLDGEIHFTQHHESHAASAFYPSPFESAAVLTLDGVGEWATTTVGIGEGNRLRLLDEIRFPHSLGLLYSAFTYFTGFRVNSGEYKLMGLAPYGEPRYADVIRRELIDLRDDGSFRLNLDYFGYLDSLRMTNRRFERLFGGPARQPETPITQRERDLARSIQVVTEEAVLRLARFARQATGERHLCLAGGVALNCVANGVLLREGVFDDLWIQPAAGDAGGALGAALAVWHQAFDRPRSVSPGRDAMRGSYLGPEFPAEDVRAFLDAHGYPFRHLADDEWAPEVARLAAEENVIGLCHGRMEFGPRALGNRSIIGDARSARMQSVMNLKIKYRESFRPFAPSVLGEKVGEWFDLDHDSPYMLLVADVASAKRLAAVGDEAELPLQEWVNRPRSVVPAITHVDYSARIQTVHADTNPRYHALIAEFDRLTGCPVIVNTSFNVRGEPIVCTPEDAYRCFMRTEMDYLVLGPYLLAKEEQPAWGEETREDWSAEYPLD
ncbi:MAG TPA: carbamoyltransferase [Thermoanaerobaculia bacterium]|nr:carbamoyltransferase [Thermoanaerobaculia bacterium]